MDGLCWLHCPHPHPVAYLFEVSHTSICILMFFFGINTPLTLSISYLLLLEVTAPSSRATVSAIACLVESSCNVWLPLLYEFGRKWRILYWLNIGLALFLVFLFLIFITESPKFLVSVKKFREARRSNKFMAKINEKPMF